VPLLSRTLAIALGAAVFGTGCIGEFIQDAFSSILLDYEIDQPRVLAMALEPPVLAHGVDTELHALIVAPDGDQATEAVWKTCGLRDDVPTYVSSLQCFAEDTDVSLVGSGSLPATYEMLDLSGIACDEDLPTWDTGLALHTHDTGDTGLVELDQVPCAHWLPLLVEAELARETVQGVLHARWFLEPWDPAVTMPITGRQREHSLTVHGDPAPGEQIRVELEVEGDLRSDGFQWYVDEGELEKTSFTAAQRYEDPPEEAPEGTQGTTWTDNLWTLPERASGTYRIWVVWAQPWVDEEVETSVPDLIWTQTQVILP